MDMIMLCHDGLTGEDDWRGLSADTPFVSLDFCCGSIGCIDNGVAKCHDDELTMDTSRHDCIIIF